MKGMVSADIMDGDEALDALAKIQTRIEDILGISFRKGLFPIQEASDEELEMVKTALDHRWEEVRTAVISPVGLQVLAVVAMTAGASFTELARKEAIRAAQNDPIADGNKDRRRAMNRLVTAISKYENGQAFMWNPHGLRGQWRGK